uniref:Pentatricopeptide repeat superfamily protein n=1 Tax=Pelargonium myrrhifolium TaxID=253081 RepID=A0A0G2T3S8_9ROSI|nr:pentatricopeptide repeat superfamily protein [Pelargonium myrrhifolium]
MKLLQSIFSGRHRPLIRAMGRRYFAANPEEYEKRNYANNLSEFNTVIGSLTGQRRYYLLRDVYDDMMLDGVQPSRDIFHSLFVGSMKGARLQDVLFFRDEMKAMGLVPDVALYNFMISTYGKTKNTSGAAQILDEMKIYGVKPNVQTYTCLLNAFALSGRLDRVYAIVRDMTAAGFGLNKFCYAGLITAHINRTPVTDDTIAKILEYVGKSKEWSSVEALSSTAENVMVGVSEEELYNLVTGEYARRRGGFLTRQLTGYHIAFHACAELRNVEMLETLMDMLEKDGQFPDIFIAMQTVRCYLRCGDIDRGLQIFTNFENTRRSAVPVELYATLIEGAMIGYTTKGMQIAQDTLIAMNTKGSFLNQKIGSDLLLAAAGEKTGGYTVANLIWDMMQAQKVIPSLPAVEAYLKGLQERDIPQDDPRLVLVSRTHEDLMRMNGRILR